MQIGKINGNAVPRPIGSQASDMKAAYRFMFEAMEELRFALQEIDRRLTDLETAKKSTKKSG